MKHLHHIVPRHMGGSDDPSNLVELTPAEHAEAHRKLYEKYGKQEDYLAWRGLAGYVGKEDIIKEKLSLNSSRPGGLNTFYGKKHTEETKRKISEKNKGHSYNKGIPKSEAHKKALSEARTNSGKVYEFLHKDGHTFKGTVRQLAEHVRSNPAEPWKLVTGKYKTHKGYRVLTTE